MKTLIGLLLGIVLGASLTLGAAKSTASETYDANGQPIHVGDIIIGDTGIPIKVHGFTVVNRPGTFAAYGYQVKVCPKCLWVETAPAEFSSTLSPQEPRGFLTRLKQLFVVEVEAVSGQDAIVWGS